MVDVLAFTRGLLILDALDFEPEGARELYSQIMVYSSSSAY